MSSENDSTSRYMHYKAILATTPEGVIGHKNGRLPWGRLKSDMTYFKDVTMGHAIIVGGNTPMPPRMPGRYVIVLSKRATKETHPWADSIVSTMDEANMIAAKCQLGDTIWMVGGASVYEAYAPLICEYRVTYVSAYVDPSDPDAVTLKGRLLDNIRIMRPERSQYRRMQADDAAMSYRVSLLAANGMPR